MGAVANRDEPRAETSNDAGIPPYVPPVHKADWYDDPTRRFEFRYWNGHEWTEHVARNGKQFTDPLISRRQPPRR